MHDAFLAYLHQAGFPQKPVEDFTSVIHGVCRVLKEVQPEWARLTLDDMDLDNARYEQLYRMVRTLIHDPSKVKKALDHYTKAKADAQKAIGKQQQSTPTKIE